MARHHFKLAMLPFNQVMLEGFTRFNTATGKGNVASALQAAHQLEVFMMASHTLLKGTSQRQSVDVVAERLADYPNAARRALQFNRSTPGLGTVAGGHQHAGAPGRSAGGDRAPAAGAQGLPGHVPEGRVSGDGIGSLQARGPSKPELEADSRRLSSGC
jgi:hypothetical protein